MDEQMIEDIRQAIVLVMPSGTCMAPSQIDRLAAAAHSVIAGKVAEQREALQTAANKFWEYVIIHQGKHTLDGDEKAARNREMAELCDAALAPHPKGME